MAINSDPHVHSLVMAANIFIRKDGKWLLLRRSPHKTFLPDHLHPFGGKLDPDEDPFVGAKREILEETGLQVNNMKLEATILEVTPVKGSDENWLIFHFTADYESGDLIPTEEGEGVYVSDEEILNGKLFPSVSYTIKHILNPDDEAVFATVHYNDDGSLDVERSTLNRCGI